MVDDSRTIRKTAKLLLERSGFEVVTAVDGMDAFVNLWSWRPDCILLDVLMPRLDGYQTCRIIRRNPGYRDTNVFMLSGQDGLLNRVLARISGANGYIEKPFTREGLLRTIHGEAGTFF